MTRTRRAGRRDSGRSPVAPDLDDGTALDDDVVLDDHDDVDDDAEGAHDGNGHRGASEDDDLDEYYDDDEAYGDYEDEDELGYDDGYDDGYDYDDDTEPVYDEREEQGPADPFATPRCQALTKEGRRCRNRTRAGSVYCPMHETLGAATEHLARRRGAGGALEPDAAPPFPGAALQRRRLVRYVVYAVLVVVVASLAAALFESTRTKVYAARTEVLFPLTEDRVGEFLREDRRLVTQIERIGSRAVLGPVATELGLEIKQLEEDISASVLTSSEIIRIEARSESPEQAALLANRIRDTYLAQVEPDAVTRSIALIDGDLAIAREALASISVELEEIDAGRQAALDNASPDQVAALLRTTAREQELVNQSTLWSGRIVDLERRRSDIELTSVVSEVPEVLTPTYVLDDPVSPRPVRAAALGAILGMLVAAVLLLGLTRPGRSARSVAGGDTA